MRRLVVLPLIFLRDLLTGLLAVAAMFGALFGAGWVFVEGVNWVVARLGVNPATFAGYAFLVAFIALALAILCGAYAMGRGFWESSR